MFAYRLIPALTVTSGVTRGLSQEGQNLTKGGPLVNTKKKLGNDSEPGCCGCLY